MTKEEFCAPCLLAIPAALGVGGAAASKDPGQNKKKKIILWVSIILTILSIIIYIYLKKRCTNCR